VHVIREGTSINNTQFGTKRCEHNISCQEAEQEIQHAFSIEAEAPN